MHSITPPHWTLSSGLQVLFLWQVRIQEIFKKGILSRGPKCVGATSYPIFSPDFDHFIFRAPFYFFHTDDKKMKACHVVTKLIEGPSKVLKGLFNTWQSPLSYGSQKDP